MRAALLLVLACVAPAVGYKVLCTCMLPDDKSGTCGSGCTTLASDIPVKSFVPATPFDPMLEFGDSYTVSTSPNKIMAMTGRWECAFTELKPWGPDNIYCDEDSDNVMVSWEITEGVLKIPPINTTVDIIRKSSGAVVKSVNVPYDEEDVEFTGIPAGVPYQVRLTTSYTHSLKPVVQWMDGTCKITACPARVKHDRDCTGAAGSGVPTGAVTCKTLKTANPALTDGVYNIDPEGDGSFVAATCDMTTSGGGWTLAISQNKGLFTKDMEKYTTEIPAADTSAVLDYYIHADLTCAVTEVRVQNYKGGKKTYKMSDFTAAGVAVMVNEDNFAVQLADHTGVIGGDNYPVLHHYDPGCGTCVGGAPCYKAASCSTAYSYGSAIVWQWGGAGCSIQKNLCAMFGGSTHMNNGWCWRGTYMWVR